MFNLLAHRFRMDGQLVILVASTGVASLYLSGGSTAHSRFSIPLDIQQDDTCFIDPTSALACLIRRASLIVWDEIPCTSKYTVEALDYTICNIMSVASTHNTALRALVHSSMD